MLEGRKTMGFLSIFPSNPMLADLLENGVPGNGSDWVPTGAPRYAYYPKPGRFVLNVCATQHITERGKQKTSMYTKHNIS